MVVYTVYDHPSDHPDHYVVRISTLADGEVKPHSLPILFDELDKARAWIARQCPGVVGFPRSPADDPVMLEVWM